MSAIGSQVSASFGEPNSYVWFISVRDHTSQKYCNADVNSVLDNLYHLCIFDLVSVSKSTCHVSCANPLQWTDDRLVWSSMVPCRRQLGRNPFQQQNYGICAHLCPKRFALLVISSWHAPNPQTRSSSDSPSLDLEQRTVK